MIYDNSVIEPYKNRGSDQKKNVGEKPIVILYNYIDHHANNTTLSSEQIPPKRFDIFPP